MKYFEKLIAGGPGRRSRLHDAEGNRIDLAGLAFAPLSLASAAARLAFDYHLPIPWLGYRATLRLAGLLGPDKDVLEFGSGMSTKWLAERARHVVSIERNVAWYQRVCSVLKRDKVTNVEYVLAEDTVVHPCPPLSQSFDIVLVDGLERRSCVRIAVNVVRPEGWIYLDNSDVESAARNELVGAAKARDWHVEPFVDFVPGYLMVTQGLLVQATSVRRTC